MSRQRFVRQELLLMWTLREIRSRYKQTLLGGAWAVIQPLSLMLVFTIVFGRIIRVDTGDIPYPVFAYTALLPWTFFAAGLSSAIPSLVNNMALITQVYVPRATFPLAAIAARLFDFLISSIVFVLLAAYYGVSPTGFWLWVPLILVVQLLLMIGVSLIGSAVTVFYRDVQQGLVLLIQLWLYATPVIYPSSAYVPNKYLLIYSLNPMVGIIESYRAVLLHGNHPPFHQLQLSVIISVVVFVIAMYLFARVEPVISDLL